MKLIKIDDYRWQLPQQGLMRVPGMVYADETLLTDLEKDEALQQVANVACLPGIRRVSLAMPDIHWGYGFPIGGVAAFELSEGVVSPGGVGYDINCGVRLATTQLAAGDIQPQAEDLANALFQQIPCGVGSTGTIKLNPKALKQVLQQGSRWALQQGLATDQDLEHTEDQGCLSGADPESVSKRALERGKDQLGTLGSGNHFLEIGRVDQIYDDVVAHQFGLFEGQITLMIHSGSRGLGHQVCDDALALMNKKIKQFGFVLPDRQLACAPLVSSEGRQYLAAMACAANYAWANRQIMMHRCRDVLQQSLHISPRTLGLRLLYDVCHNIAKQEIHPDAAGQPETLCVHRKGATRAFPPGHTALPPAYRSVGQPVIVPGDMGRSSYVLVGTSTAMQETFGSTCHGAGRLLSRQAAKKAARGRAIHRELAEKGVIVRWTGRGTLAEEMPEAYKNVSAVVQVVHEARIARKVARLKPLVVIKG